MSSQLIYCYRPFEEETHGSVFVHNAINFFFLKEVVHSGQELGKSKKIYPYPNIQI